MVVEQQRQRIKSRRFKI